MSADLTAYAVLGLQPGADRKAVEAAYKKLIKLHHPDREGGDSERASEINRAYLELRGKAPPEFVREDPSSLAEAIYARRTGWRMRKIKRPPRPWIPIFTLVLIGVGVGNRDALGAWSQRLDQAFHGAINRPVVYVGGAERAERAAGIEEPLHGFEIDASIRAARRLLKAGGSEELVEYSRDCHRRMRAAPAAALLDRCAAFDMAVAAISHRDPMRDEGPFSASAVTARQMIGARQLSDDYNAIETRLDLIRARVEAALAPEMPPPLVQFNADQAVLTPLDGRLPD